MTLVVEGGTNTSPPLPLSVTFTILVAFTSFPSLSVTEYTTPYEPTVDVFTVLLTTVMPLETSPSSLSLAVAPKSE